MTYRLLDLFSGIGGFSLGLERSGGFKTVAFCEVELFCTKILNKHWPEVPVYGDVRELTAERLAADGIGVDAICGGFPCQDISTAGKGAGIEGERSGLWSEYARLIGELRPRYVFVENVAALLGRGMDRVLGDLAALGYDAEWHCIPASAIGAPHRRDRIWVMAYPAIMQCDGRDDYASVSVGAKPESKSRDNRWAYDVAYSNSIGQSREGLLWPISQAQGGKGKVNQLGDGCADAADMADPDCQRLQRRPSAANFSGFGPWLQQFIERRADGIGAAWSTESNVGRVANGIPHRVDRLKALGNAVVPQIPELLGRAVLHAEGKAA